MKTREIKIKASLEKEGVLKEIIENTKRSEELFRVFKVLDVLNNNQCKSYTITHLESRVFGIERSSILAGVLGKYKEYVLNESE